MTDAELSTWVYRARQSIIDARAGYRRTINWTEQELIDALGEVILRIDEREKKKEQIISGWRVTVAADGTCEVRDPDGKLAAKTADTLATGVQLAMMIDHYRKSSQSKEREE
jgi:hypothetical protein